MLEVDTSLYIKELVCVRPSVRYPIGWNYGYHSVSGKITQCDGYILYIKANMVSVRLSVTTNSAGQGRAAS